MCQAAGWSELNISKDKKDEDYHQCESARWVERGGLGRWQCCQSTTLGWSALPARIRIRNKGNRIRKHKKYCQLHLQGLGFWITVRLGSSEGLRESWKKSNIMMIVIVPQR